MILCLTVSVYVSFMYLEEFYLFVSCGGGDGVTVFYLCSVFPLDARHRLSWLQVKDSWGQAFAFARHDVIEGVCFR